MENYIVTLKYHGRVDFPGDPEQAMVEAQGILLPLIKQHEFKLLAITELQISERSTHSDYSSDLFEQCCVLEVKIRLSEEELSNETSIYDRIIYEAESGKFIVERIDENPGDDVQQSLVTIAEKDRYHHYLVNFKVEGQLENLTSDKDEEIITEILMLLQAGDVALLAYEVTHDLEIDNQCETDPDTITENHTIFEIRLVINEFNVDFNDIETLYYYVLGQLSHCESAVTYKYSCGDAPNIKTVIGVDIHCSVQSLAFDDIEDLFEEF